MASLQGCNKGLFPTLASLHEQTLRDVHKKPPTAVPISGTFTRNSPAHTAPAGRSNPDSQQVLAICHCLTRAVPLPSAHL